MIGFNPLTLGEGSEEGLPRTNQKPAIQSIAQVPKKNGVTMKKDNDPKKLTAKKRLDKICTENRQTISDDQAFEIAKEVMAWLFDHVIRLEFSVTHASALDAVAEIVGKGGRE